MEAKLTSGTKRHNSEATTIWLSIIFSIYSAFSIFTTWTELQNVVPTILVVYKMFQWLIIALLVMSFIASIPSLRLALVFVVLVLLGVYSTISLHDYRFLMFVLFSFATTQANLKIVIRMNLIINIFVFASVVFMNLVGFLPDEILYRTDAQIVRHSLGFAHPNFLGAMILLIILEYFYVRSYKITVFELVILLVFNWFFMFISDSRATGFIAIATMLAFTFVKIFGEIKFNKIFMDSRLKFLIQNLSFVLALVSILVTVMVKPGTQIFTELSTLTSGRIDIFQYYFGINGFHLWPKAIKDLFQNSTFVGMDNAYINLMVSFGILILISYCLLLRKFTIQIMENKSSSLLIIIIAFMIWGLVESTIVYPFVGFFCLVYRNTLMEDKNVKNSHSL